MPVGTGSILEQSWEARDPGANRAAIDLYSTLGKPLDHICVAEAIPNVPADSEGDGVIGEVIVGQGTP